ncbi:hypothetical protein WJX84_000170 [Apatococcus fuscideae]|uniref:Uncharacterized protein n=1 Tax=Apatococcus fuscideae TaxID=2026836 RepID=A0AAW1T5Z6_9CHLO
MWKQISNASQVLQPAPSRRQGMTLSTKNHQQRPDCGYQNREHRQRRGNSCPARRGVQGQEDVKPCSTVPSFKGRHAPLLPSTWQQMVPQQLREGALGCPGRKRQQPLDKLRNRDLLAASASIL